MIEKQAGSFYGVYPLQQQNKLLSVIGCQNILCLFIWHIAVIPVI
jgi:hypothetical protein